MKSNFHQTFIYIFEINLSSNYIFKQECIPVGCVLPAAVAIMGGVSTHRHTPLEQGPPGAGTPLEQAPPGCGPGDPPRCGPGDPLARPLNIPLGCGPGNLQDMLGYTPPNLLQGMLGYHLQCMLGYHPPVNRITDTCKNITLPQLRCER